MNPSSNTQAASPAGRPIVPGLADVTVIMTAHRRTRYCEHYLQEGLWDGVPLLIIDDGTAEAVGSKIQAIAAQHHLSIHRHPSAQGAAQAIRTGVAHTRTPHFMLVGEEDFFLGLPSFADAAQAQQQAGAVLFATVPYLYCLNEACQTEQQSDRRRYDGMTGRALLRRLVESGDAEALLAGAMFDKRDVAGLLPEPFFKTCADLALLCRLCGHYPDRKIYVPDTGRYMRLVPDHPLLVGSGWTESQAVMNLAAMCVGGYYLMAMGETDAATLAALLRKRGQALQRKYGLGSQAAAVVAGLVEGVGFQAVTAEARRTRQLLRDQFDVLPAEFLEVVGDGGQAVLRAPVHVKPLRVLARDRAPRVSKPERGAGAHVFLGGCSMTGTPMVQQLLCLDLQVRAAVPPANYLRNLMHAYREGHQAARREVGREAGAPVDPLNPFHAEVVQVYLERLVAPLGRGAHVACYDPALTPYFALLHRLNPGHRFICTVRDPRDVIGAFLATPPGPSPQDPIGAAIERRDIEWLCQHYRACYAPVLAASSEAFNENVLFVHYEDLAVRPRAVVQRLEAFTGFHLSAWTHQQPPPPQASIGVRHIGPLRPPLFAEAQKAQTAQTVGFHTRTLTMAEIQTVEAACVDLFEVFGYPFHLRATG